MNEFTHPSQLKDLVEEMEQRIVHLHELTHASSRPDGLCTEIVEGAPDEAPD